MAVGGSGGSKIFGAVLQVILGIDQWGLDASEAVEYGRVHDQLYPLEVETDSVVPQYIIDGLLERGARGRPKVDLDLERCEVDEDMVAELSRLRGVRQVDWDGESDGPVEGGLGEVWGEVDFDPDRPWSESEED